MQSEPVIQPKIDQELRRPGRAPGSPRVPGSGRRRGVPNKTTSELRAMIVTRGRPIEFLCAVCAGERVRIGPVAGPDKPTYRYPTFEERMRAAAILAAKLLPDLKAQELTGKDGGPIETKEVSALETARRIAFLLRAGLEAQEQGAS